MRIDETWRRTVVGEKPRRRPISAVPTALESISSTRSWRTVSGASLRFGLCWTGAGPAARAELHDHAGDEGARNRGLPAPDPAERGAERPRLDVLEQVSDRPGIQRGEQLGEKADGRRRRP